MIARAVDAIFHDARLEPVFALGALCRFRPAHARQVARLAHEILRGLEAAGFEFDARAPHRLVCAALLHDIGWIAGRRGHHKTSMRLILDSELLAWDRQERLLIGSIARYHRKALPSRRHAHFAALEANDQQCVQWLAGVLRVADGLDFSHRGAIQTVDVVADRRGLLLRCASDSPSARAEIERAEQKGDLLRRALDKRLRIEWRQPAATPETTS